MSPVSRLFQVVHDEIVLQKVKLVEIAIDCLIAFEKLYQATPGSREALQRARISVHRQELVEAWRQLRELHMLD